MNNNQTFPRKISSLNTFKNTWTFSVLLGTIITVILFIALAKFALQNKPLNMVDEHMHLDYAVSISHGVIPFRGQLMSDEVTNEWICGVGHQAGSPSPCSDISNFDKANLPSGKYSSAYAHFPTYFYLASGFSTFVSKIFPDITFLQGLRVFSALLTALSAFVFVLFAKKLGFGAGKQLLVGLIPSSASSAVFYGTIVNPSSSLLLLGAISTGFGLLWLKKGKGFIWFATAALLGSTTLFISNLTVFAFVLFLVAALLYRKYKQNVTLHDNLSKLRWWHPIVLLAIAIGPMLLWVIRISTSATKANSELYSGDFFNKPSPLRFILNLIGESFRFHVPWFEDYNVLPVNTENMFWPVRAELNGIPLLLNLLFIGTLLFYVIYNSQKDKLTIKTANSKQQWLKLMIWSTLITLFAYSPLLRLSQLIISNYDLQIMDRYSLSLMPLIVILALYTIQNKIHFFVVFIPTLAASITLIAYISQG